MAPTRSTQGARLSTSHHTRTANEHTSAPINTPIPASGATYEAPNQSSHCSATATTPGQSRIGFRGAGSTVLLMGIAASPCDSSMLLVAISFAPNADCSGEVLRIVTVLLT